MDSRVPLAKLAGPSRYVILLVMTIAVILVTIYCLMNWLYDIFSLMYYPPIILATYWFLQRGLYYAAALGLAYFSAVLYFSHGAPLDLITAAARFSIFMVLAFLTLVFTMKILEQRDQLEQSELKFRTIWENVESAIILVDADTHLILAANPAAEHLTGYKEEELLGRCCHQLVCPAERHKCPISDLNQKVDHSERTLLTRNGTPMLVVKTVSRATVNGKAVFIENFVPLQAHRLLRDNKV
ncbi:MAG: PAS domain S-box protein [Methanomicrobiales archaeon]|nr:PAS domain S-box protein [Methanomicrobiales archaeon]